MRPLLSLLLLTSAAQAAPVPSLSDASNLKLVKTICQISAEVLVEGKKDPVLSQEVEDLAVLEALSWLAATDKGVQVKVPSGPCNKGDFVLLLTSQVYPDKNGHWFFNLKLDVVALEMQGFQNVSVYNMHVFGGVDARSKVDSPLISMAQRMPQNLFFKRWP